MLNAPVEFKMVSRVEPNLGSALLPQVLKDRVKDFLAVKDESTHDQTWRWQRLHLRQTN
jgi:hypothetical protein